MQAPLLPSQRLVSRSYFCLYLSWMAGSYEIITFLSVPRSCVRQASRLPNQQCAWAAICRHITHFITHSKFPQAATFIHIQARVTHTRTHVFSLCVRALLSSQWRCKLNCRVFRSRAATAGLCVEETLCVCVCMCVWGDVTFLGWHEATVCPLAPGGSSQGKTLMEVWGLRGGISWCEQKALRCGRKDL